MPQSKAYESMPFLTYLAEMWTGLLKVLWASRNMYFCFVLFLSDRQNDRDTDTYIFHSLVLFTNDCNKPELSQDETRNLQLLFDIPCGWQGPRAAASEVTHW